MLTKQDLKQINTIIEDRIDKLAVDVLRPAFAELESKMATKEEIKSLERRIDEKFDYQTSWLKEKFEDLTTLINQHHSRFYIAINILYEKKIFTRQNLKSIAQG